MRIPFLEMLTYYSIRPSRNVLDKPPEIFDFSQMERQQADM
jgi:hypothetical protein